MRQHTAEDSTRVIWWESSVQWVLVVGILLSFVLAAGLGANDVSNTFGTTIGSGAISVVQAYILATIFMSLGAVLIGWSETDMMRTGVIDMDDYKDTPRELMLGQLAVLGGTAVSQAVTTAFSLPVSTTDAVAWSTLGFSLVLRGGAGINWNEVCKYNMDDSGSDQAELNRLAPEKYDQLLPTRSRPLTHFARRFIIWILPDRNRINDERTIHMFSTIEVFTACSAGFAIGAYDFG
ncbi:phosphate transporter family protein [Oesophagostomum dentatum]|uniref:Phosphate transporter family protein n=1 Tax=Oesophagostomum dentatum TaxID=61180 RepID=A0A0B1SAX1_OESDE|nr:phosphate transporter family protein [Oesophagostomum dentatum]